MKLIKYIEKYSQIIIIVLLISVLFLYRNELGFGRMTEGFESTVANSVSAIEQKFNQAFGMINAQNVEIKQNLKLKEYLNVAKGIDSGHDIVAQRNITAEGNVNSNNKVTAQGDIKGKRLCIGGTCLDENHLKLLTDGFKMKIEVGKSSGQFIHSHANHRLGPHGNSPAKFKLYKY